MEICILIMPPLGHTPVRETAVHDLIPVKEASIPHDIVPTGGFRQ